MIRVDQVQVIQRSPEYRVKNSTALRVESKGSADGIHLENQSTVGQNRKQPGTRDKVTFASVLHEKFEST